MHCQTGSSPLSWHQSQNGAVAQHPHTGCTDWVWEVPQGQSLYWIMVWILLLGLLLSALTFSSARAGQGSYLWTKLWSTMRHCPQTVLGMNSTMSVPRRGEEPPWQLPDTDATKALNISYLIPALAKTKWSPCPATIPFSYRPCCDTWLWKSLLPPWAVPDYSTAWWSSEVLCQLLGACFSVTAV